MPMMFNGGKRAIVGKWVGTNPEYGATLVPTDIQFKADVEGAVQKVSPLLPYHNGVVNIHRNGRDADLYDSYDNWKYYAVRDDAQDGVGLVSKKVPDIGNLNPSLWGDYIIGLTSLGSEWNYDFTAYDSDIWEQYVSVAYMDVYANYTDTATHNIEHSRVMRPQVLKLRDGSAMSSGNYISVSHLSVWAMKNCRPLHSMRTSPDRQVPTLSESLLSASESSCYKVAEKGEWSWWIIADHGNGVSGRITPQGNSSALQIFSLKIDDKNKDAQARLSYAETCATYNSVPFSAT